MYSGRIKDTFTPVVKEKLAQYGIETTEHVVLDDNMDKIVAAISELKEKGVDMIACTGGMSVDPDDQTPGAIKQSGANIITYGSPVLPGAMFLLAYFDDGAPICRLPGCVLYNKTIVFDIVLPRIAAGVPLEKKTLPVWVTGDFAWAVPPVRSPTADSARELPCRK